MLLENKIREGKNQVLLVYKLMRKIYSQSKMGKPAMLVPSDIAERLGMRYAHTVPSVLVKNGYARIAKKQTDCDRGYVWNTIRPTMLDAAEVQLYAYRWTNVIVEPELETTLREFAAEYDSNKKKPAILKADSLATAKWVNDTPDIKSALKSVTSAKNRMNDVMTSIIARIKTLEITPDNVDATLEFVRNSIESVIGDSPADFRNKSLKSATVDELAKELRSRPGVKVNATLEVHETRSI